MADTGRQKLTEQQLPSFAWMEAPYLRRVVNALEAAAPNSARFVGGCVRDSLLGETPKDFDIATMLSPDGVVAALKKAGLRSAPTGIDHGTITAIVEHQGVEVTTLRKDVSTDGRRASVAFTQDWSVDAGRRDFTINAIYLSPDKTIYDPVGGVADAAERRVRFIGDARQRIREDYLRILRFFRFSARFSQAFDADDLASCAALKDGLGQLSAERIGAELSAILSLPRAAFALEAMVESGVLAQIWPANANVDAVARIKKMAPATSPPVVLAALFPVENEGVGSRLRLSNAEKSIRSNALKTAALIDDKSPQSEIRATVYRLGRDVFLDGVIVAAALGAIDETTYERLTKQAESWQAPEFPISGADVVAAGAPEGPKVGRILSAVEAQWIAEEFPPADRVQKILAEKLAARD